MGFVGLFAGIKGALDYNAVELAKTHSSIAGVLCGFALTIFVLLLSRRDAQSSSEPEDNSIGFFLATFFVALVAAFAMGEVASEPVLSGNPMAHPRTYATLLPAASALGLGAIMLTLGICHALRSYGVAGQLGFGYLIHFLTMSIAYGFYASTCGELVELRSPGGKAIVQNICYLGTALSLAMMCWRVRSPWQAPENLLSRYMGLLCVAAVLCALAVHEWLQLPRDFTPAILDLAVLLALYFVFIGASVLGLPSKKAA